MYVTDTDTDRTNDLLTVGWATIKKPHNEKPIAKLNVNYLKEWVELIESETPEGPMIPSVYLWSTHKCENENVPRGLLVATHERDATEGMALAGMKMEDEK